MVMNKNIDYNLSLNESIIWRCDAVEEFKEIVLTNNNIICVNSGGLFKAPVIQKYPLRKISCLNGVPQVNYKKGFKEKPNILERLQEMNTSFDCKITIFFVDTSLSFTLIRASKDEVVQESSYFVDKIHELITGRVPNKPNVRQEEKGFFSRKKNLNSARTSEISNGNTSGAFTAKCISCRAPITGLKGATVKCSYCDSEQVI